MLKLPFNIFLFVILIMNANPISPFSFIPSTDPRLNQVAKPVEISEIKSEKIQSLINRMLTLSGQEADPTNYEHKGILVGLAAPQVGEMHQIIIINTLTYQEIKEKKQPVFDVLINPKIIWESVKSQVSHEGCFSVPEQFIGIPNRPLAVEVEAYDRFGRKVIKKYENDIAAVVHHEIDHLNGIRFPQRLNSEQELHLLKDDSDLANYRLNWQKWPKHASSSLWQQMKNGDYSNATLN